LGMPDDTPDRRIVPRRKPATGQVENYEPRDDDSDPEGPSEADLERFGDVTVTCPECGTELFDDVALCWKCGRAVGSGAAGEGKTPKWAVVVAAILLAGFLFFLVGRLL
jgi:hypothetical protein